MDAVTVLRENIVLRRVALLEVCSGVVTPQQSFTDAVYNSTVC